MYMNGGAIVLLAAGASRRLGYPKQLVEFGHTPLLERSLQAALEVLPKSCFVVTGSQRLLYTALLNQYQVEEIYNPAWQEGMGASIRIAVKYLLPRKPNFLLFSVIDQPFLRAIHFQQLIDYHRHHPKSILISEYECGQGPPALFPPAYFSQLSALQGDQGARELVRQPGVETTGLPFPKGHLDIDHPYDIERIKAE